MSRVRKSRILVRDARSPDAGLGSWRTCGTPGMSYRIKNGSSPLTLQQGSLEAEACPDLPVRLALQKFPQSKRGNGTRSRAADARRDQHRPGQTLALHSVMTGPRFLIYRKQRLPAGDACAHARADWWRLGSNKILSRT